MYVNILILLLMFESSLGFPPNFFPPMKKNLKISRDENIRIRRSSNLSISSRSVVGSESSKKLPQELVNLENPIYSDASEDITCVHTSLFSMLDFDESKPILNPVSRKRDIEEDYSQTIGEGKHPQKDGKKKTQETPDENKHIKCHNKLFKFIYSGEKNDTNRNKTEFPHFLLNLANRIALRTHDVNKHIYEKNFEKFNKVLRKKRFSNIDKLIKNVSVSANMLRNISLSFQSVPDKLENMSYILHDIFKYIRYMTKTMMNDPHFLRTLNKLKQSALAIDRSYETIRQLSLKISLLSESLFYHSKLLRSLMKSSVESKLDPNFTLMQLLKILSDFVGIQNEIVDLLNDQKKIFHYLNVQVEILQKYASELEVTVNAEEEENFDRFTAIVNLIQEMRKTPLPSMKMKKIKQYHFHDFKNIHKTEKEKPVPEVHKNIATDSLLSNPRFKICSKFLDRENPCRNISKYVDCIYGKKTADKKHKNLPDAMNKESSDTDETVTTTSLEISTSSMPSFLDIKKRMFKQIFSNTSPTSSESTEESESTPKFTDTSANTELTELSTEPTDAGTKSTLFYDYNLDATFKENGRSLLDEFIRNGAGATTAGNVDKPTLTTETLIMPRTEEMDAMSLGLPGGVFELNNIPKSVPSDEFYEEPTEILVFPEKLLEETYSLPEFSSEIATTTYASDISPIIVHILNSSKQNEISTTEVTTVKKKKSKPKKKKTKIITEASMVSTSRSKETTKSIVSTTTLHPSEASEETESTVSTETLPISEATKEMESAISTEITPTSEASKETESTISTEISQTSEASKETESTISTEISPMSEASKETESTISTEISQTSEAGKETESTISTKISPTSEASKEISQITEAGASTSSTEVDTIKVIHITPSNKQQLNIDLPTNLYSTTLLSTSLTQPYSSKTPGISVWDHDMPHSGSNLMQNLAPMQSTEVTTKVERVKVAPRSTERIKVTPGITGIDSRRFIIPETTDTTEITTELPERFIEIEGKMISECKLLDILTKFYSSICKKKNKKKIYSSTEAPRKITIERMGRKFVHKNLLEPTTVSATTTESATEISTDTSTEIHEELFKPLFTPNPDTDGDINLIDEAYLTDEDNEFWPYHKLHRLNRDNVIPENEPTELKIETKSQNFHPQGRAMPNESPIPVSIYQMDKVYGDVFYDKPIQASQSKYSNREIEALPSQDRKFIENNFQLPLGNQDRNVDLSQPKEFLQDKLKENSTEIEHIFGEFRKEYQQTGIKPVIYRHFKARENMKCDKSEALLYNCRITVHHLKQKGSTDWNLRLICGCQMPDYVGDCPKKIQEGIDNIINFCSLIMSNMSSDL